MSKKSSKSGADKSGSPAPENGKQHNGANGGGSNGVDRVEFVSISQETRRRYLNYALSVITSRALPDVRDGLKPVQRRVLYVMYEELRLTADAKTRKSAKVCGDTTGNYHPHGEASVYDTLVRLAQNFSLRYPLVNGQGNFGSIIGLPAAAARYTEVKLTAIAEQLMNELRFETVDTRPTYDAVKDEPIVLPARFPNLLVNGTQGIAVGMATNIPPHNLGEVVKACVHLIHEPDATVAQLMKFVKGPDFPLGGRIVTDRQLDPRGVRRGPRLDQSPRRMETREGSQGGDRQQNCRHVGSLRRRDRTAADGHRRHHQRPQAAAARRRGGRVRRKAPAADRAGAEARIRSRSRDGLPVSAHGPRAELRDQHHVPRAGRTRRTRAGADQPQGPACGTFSISASNPSRGGSSTSCGSSSGGFTSSKASRSSSKGSNRP